MERTLEKPLNEDDIRDLKARLEDTAKLLAAIDKATRAGIDMAERRKEVMASRDQIQKLLNTYGGF